MRKGFLLVVVGLAGFAAAVVPFATADGTNTATVTANPNSVGWSDNAVGITPGGTVTFSKSAGTLPHNVHFTDAAPFPGSDSTHPDSPSMSAWSTTGTFPNTGAFNFVCQQHGSMSGTVYVNAAGTVPTGTTTTGTTGTTGTTTTGPGGGPPPGSPGDITKPALTGAKASRDHFCTRKSSTCKKPGVTIKLKLSEPAKVTATVLRRKRVFASAKPKFKKFGSVKLSGKKGSNTFTFRTASGKRLTPADYKVELVAADPVGNRSAKKTVKFFVRPS